MLNSSNDRTNLHCVPDTKGDAFSISVTYNFCYMILKIAVILVAATYQAKEIALDFWFAVGINYESMLNIIKSFTAFIEMIIQFSLLTSKYGKSH